MFLAELRKASAKGDGQAPARNQLWLDGDALDGWLEGLTGRDAYIAAEAGFELVRACGPYRGWMGVYNRAKTDGLAPEQQSNRLWWLASVAQRALANIAILRLQQADATSRSDAADLLTQAHRAFTRMRLPEAETVRRIAERHGLSIDGAETI